MTASALNISNTTITASTNLRLIVQEGVEGLGKTYSAKVTLQQLVDFFPAESEEISESDRNQRLIEKSRAKAMSTYLTERDNWTFPALTIVVTQLELTELLTEFNGVRILMANIPALADRLIVDGQHRMTSASLAILIKASLSLMHVDIKIIVLKTKTVHESSVFVRQIFCDINSKGKKTTPSQNINFNNESALARFTKESIVISDKLGANSNKGFSRDGKIKHGQLYNVASLSDFSLIMIGSTTQKVEAFLSEEGNYDLYLILVSQFMAAMYKQLTFLNEIQVIANKKEWKSAIDDNVLTCAIGLRSLAYVGRSMIEAALEEKSSEIDTTKLYKILELPLTDSADQLWLDKQIFCNIDGNIKIEKSSEKRLANILCHKMRLLPCNSLV